MTAFAACVINCEYLRQVAASATSALAQLQATVQQQQQQQAAAVSTTRNVSSGMTLNPVTGELMPAANAVATEANGEIAGHTEQYFVTEDGVPISAASTEEPGTLCLGLGTMNRV